MHLEEVGDEQPASVEDEPEDENAAEEKNEVEDAEEAQAYEDEAAAAITTSGASIKEGTKGMAMGSLIKRLRRTMIIDIAHGRQKSFNT